MAALYNCQTKTRYNKSLKLAIKAALPNKKVYINKKWPKTPAYYANYAHFYSFLLPQVMDTNVIES